MKWLGPVVGGVLGFVYYTVVGCGTGGCPITSNPWTSIGYGALLGWLVGGTLKKSEPEPPSTDEDPGNSTPKAHEATNAPV